jgi:glutathione S-transferase
VAAKPKLFVLSYSPWSERARWALDHHRLAYRVVQHLPFVGELRLRRLARGRARATVPVLVDGDLVLSESWDIAAHADRIGPAAKLMPAEHEAAIRRWAELADETMAAGRALVVDSLLKSPEALDESLPLPMPGWVRRASRPIARFATQWFARKYELRLDEREAPERKIQAGLEALRRALGGKRYLLGQFSYADIVMATFLQAVSPVDDAYIRLGPATRRAWTLPALAAEYHELVRWRDELYAGHRR